MGILPPFVAVEFSTVVKYMSFLGRMFSHIFPPDFEEYSNVSGMTV